MHGERGDGTGPSVDDAQPEKSAGGWSPVSVYTLGLLTIAYAFNYFDRLLISLLFPLIKHDLALTDTDLGLISGVAFVLIYAVMGIPVARLADRSSRKMIIGIGFSFWSLMTLLTGFAKSFWQLMLTRFLMGIGESSGVPSSSSMLTDLFDRKRRSLAFSIMVTGTSVSSLLLTPAAGWVAQTYGWRVAYWTAGSVGLVFGTLVWLTVREPQRGRFDPPGSAAVATTDFWGSVAFVLRQPSYIYTTLSASLFIVSFYGYIVWNVTFLVRIHHLDVAHASRFYGPISGVSGLLGGLCAGPLLRWLTRRHDGWQVGLPALCMAVNGLSQYLYLFSPDLVGVGAAVALGSFSVTMAVPLISLILIQVLPASIRTFGMAMYFFINSLIGDIFGPLGVGWLNDHFQSLLGEGAIRYSMAATAGIALIAVPVMLLVIRHLAADIGRANAWRPTPSLPDLEQSAS